MTAWSDDRRAALAQMAAVLPDHDVVVIGAVAVAHHLGPGFRTTLDLDLCVATSGSEPAPPRSWRRSATSHRWRTDLGMAVDLLPVSSSSLEQGFIAWSDGSRLSLIGIDLAMRDSLPIGHGLPHHVRVASLRALFLCKAVAWTDRPGDRNKDLNDLAEILERYGEHADARYYDDPAIPLDLDFSERPAFLLGLDLGAVCSPTHRAHLTRFLTSVGDPDQSPHAIMARRWPHEEGALGRRLDALRAGLAADRP